jgi:hypothetical protein
MGEEFETLFREVPEELEARLLEVIGDLLSDASARYEQFREDRALQGSGAEGFTKEQLNAFLADARRFDAEFTKHDASAQRLAAAGYPEVQTQLTAIQHDLQRSIAEVEEACHLREAFDARYSQAVTRTLGKTTLDSGQAEVASLPQTEEERRMLGRIEEIYEQFCQAGIAFGALCTQYSYGPPTAILEGHWQQLEEMESRFADMDAEANRLAAVDHPAAKQRLAQVRGDLMGTIAIVKKMYAARTEAEVRASELEAHAAQGLAESMHQMARALSGSRGGKG